MIFMRRTLFLASAVAILAPFPWVFAQDAGSGDGWYIGAKLGASRVATIGQEGWNREPYCYPDQGCFDQSPLPTGPGYRWRYDLEPDSGAEFEVFAGRGFRRVRLELAVSMHRNDLTQQFTGISYFDGSPIAPRPNGTVSSNSQAYADNFNARAITLNAYYDFPDAWGSVTPYLGAGIGFASLEVAGVHFSSDYRDSAGETYDPPLSFYNSTQNGDFRETRFTWRLHAGADYPMAANLLLGVKLTYSFSGDFEDTGVYEVHPFNQQDPGFSNTNRFDSPHSLTLAITLKRFIGS